MGYAILRAEPRTVQGTAAMLRHALREDAPPNAVPGAAPPELIAGLPTSGQGMAKLREAVDAAKAGKRWQKSVKPVLDVLVTFSRDDAARLSADEQADYFRRALEFVQERFGGAENLLTATVHRDESTAHVQILMLARERGGVKLGASQYMGNRGNLHKLQNDFWRTCGEPFGMRRGEPYTGIKNLPVRQLYGALAAGAEVPQLVDVPEVSLTDKLLRPERMTQRDRAIQHNQAAIEELRAQAKRGQGLHPKIVEQQAERYRRAVEQADKAEEEAHKALQRVAEARRQGQEAEARLARIEAAERYIAELDKRIAAKQAEERQLDASIERKRQPAQQEDAAIMQAAQPAPALRRQLGQAELKRIADLPARRKTTAGAALEFCECAMVALRSAGGKPEAVDWHEVERVAARQALANGQDEAAVVSGISYVSPLRLDDTAQAELARTVSATRRRVTAAPRQTYYDGPSGP